MDQLVDWLISLNIPTPLALLTAGLVGVFAAVAFISTLVMLLVWAERRVAGRMQARLGPNRVGPFGLFQSLADSFKLLLKEDIVPSEADRFWYKFAPYMVLAGAMVPLAVLPLSNHLYITRMDLGVYFFLAFASFEVLGLLMAGWGSSSKWSLYGAIRLITQMISYEIPLGLSVLTVVTLTGSLRFHDIVDAQGWDPLHWYLFQSPFTFLAGIIFFIAGLAETKRLPFDLPEAESELVAGFHTEYSGMRFSLFFLAEYAAMFMVSAATAILFLGGWAAPPFLKGIPGVGAVIMVGKWSFLLFIMLWIRWTFPRMRLDQIMRLCLKIFLPISFVCLVGSGLWLILREMVVGHLPMMILGWVLTLPIAAHAIKVVWKGA